MQVSALLTYSIPTSGSPCCLPVADTSTLEFNHHHPDVLWPSNSQPLWPEQINNKASAFHRSWRKTNGRYTCAILTSNNIPGGVLSRRQNKYAFIFGFFCFFNPTLATFYADLASEQNIGLTNAPSRVSALDNNRNVAFKVTVVHECTSVLRAAGMRPQTWTWTRSC